MYLHNRRAFLLSCGAYAVGGILALAGCSRALPEEKRLVVACGNDIGGLAISAALKRGADSSVDFGSDEAPIGDCCGSTAQFTLSTGDVDVAVLCPDAVQNLAEAGEDYVELGVVVYDGNVLVAPSGNALECKNIGYMAERNQQLAVLERLFEGHDVNFRALYTFATAYALANGLVDAATMDVAAAAKTGYPAQPFTEGQPTSVLVARGSLVGNPQVGQLVETCNAFLRELCENEETLAGFLGELLENDNAEEVLSWWSNTTTRFGYLTAATA